MDNSPPATMGRRLSSFLVLAPASSSNYPLSPTTLSPADAKDAVSPGDDLASPVVKPTETVTADVDPTPKDHRSSSVSSTSSNSAQFRFLKLGPVHFGKGDGPTDFAEVDE